MSRHRTFCCDLVDLIAEKTVDAGNLTLTQRASCNYRIRLNGVFESIALNEK